MITLSTDPNRAAPGTAQDSSVEMIQVPNTLLRKVGPRFGGIDPSAVAKAEAALKNLSGQFSQWLNDELVKLEEARTAIKTQGMSAATADRLYVHAHDLKGLGTTYEFPLITRLAGSLCKLMDEPGVRATAPMFSASCGSLRITQGRKISLISGPASYFREPFAPLRAVLSEGQYGQSS